ncbi:MAG: radical SAM protein, partial [Candidatus Neoclostridium sp.]
KSLKKEGVRTAVDTCGFASKESFDKVMPYVDSFLYDIKAMDEDVHIRCTGQSNKPVLDNLKYIDSCGKNVEIRIPFVPGFNDDQTEKIAAFLGGLKNVTGIRLLPYHDLAGSKYDALGAENTLPKRIPDKDALLKAEKILSAAARIIK